MCLKRIVHAYSFNSLRPGDAYMRHWNESELIQVMACRLFGAKPLPEPMVDYCQLGIKFIELFLSRLHGRISHRFGGRYCSSAGYSNKISISVSSLWLVKSHDKHSRDLLKWGPRKILLVVCQPSRRSATGDTLWSDMELFRLGVFCKHAQVRK